MTGERRMFRYPSAFTTLPEYTKHNGSIVTVIRQLTLGEASQECQPMYEILADDGWKGHAWYDELEPLP